MLSILIGHAYFLRFDQKQWQRAKPYPPLATLQVATSLRREGHHVALFDAMLATGVKEFDAALAASRPQLVLFYEDNYNFLTKMCLSRMREAACEMIATAHRAGARVIVAGSDATDAPQAYLAAGAEAVLLGEGLVCLRTLIDRLDADAAISTAELVQGLPGIVSNAKGKLAPANFAQVRPEHEHPAVAAWDLIDIDRYRAVWREAHGVFSLNMASSRGCSFRCNWCAKPIWGSQYLQRPPAEVAAEMAYLKQQFQPDHVWFADDIFGFRVDWVEHFGAEVRRLGGGIPFTIQSRADLISEPMARALAAAGCREVWIGAESGSQRILDAMNKGTQVADIGSARTRLAMHGIRVGLFIQLGYLGEMLEDILLTRQLLETLRPDDIGVSVSYPLPGTKFYETVKSQLQAKTHWQESNDLEMMFEGTYHSDFYRAVRDLLHEEVSLRHGAGAGEGHAELAPVQRELDRRWDQLIAQERHYRAGAPQAAMRG